MGGVSQKKVLPEENDMRLDRWFSIHFAQLPFGRLQRLLRKGEIRVDKKRAKTNTRLVEGQEVRIPPLDAAPKPSIPKHNEADAKFLRDLIIYEDADVYVFNKPHGIAVQGGSGTKRHIDGMLKSLPNKKGEAPRLVHRLDRDTSGCLLVAKTRSAASFLGKVFRSRSARKIYWALCVGVPNPPQGNISCFLGKQKVQNGEQMAVVHKDTKNAQHSQSYYSVIDNAGREFSWVSLKPVTGRTHQLRVHMKELGVPILDDPRYFELDNYHWQRPDDLGQGLHLHARRLALPLPSNKRLDITAPLSPHMQQSFDLLGFDSKRYDAQDNDPQD
jgi:23S rRNA pseudouridine955/2504/2580 synthase